MAAAVATCVSADLGTLVTGPIASQSSSKVVPPLLAEPAVGSEIGARGGNSPVRLRVGLVGEFGVGNIGNNASAAEVIRRIRLDFGDRVVVELISRGAERAEQLFGVRALPMKSDEHVQDRGFARLTRQIKDAVHLLRAAGRYDVVIVPGTGLLEAEVSGGSTGIMNALAVVSLAAMVTHRPLIWIGVGSGRLRTVSARFVTRVAAKGARRRSYRDSLSMTEVVGSTRQTSGDVLSRDVVFGRPINDRVELPVATGDFVVAVGAIDLPKRAARGLSMEATRARYVTNLARVCDLLLEEGAHLRFVLGDEADLAITEQVRSEIWSTADAGARQPLVETHSFDGLERAIAGADVVLASRYHTILAASLVYRPVIALSHSPKDDQLMLQLRATEYCFGAFDFDPDLVVSAVKSARIGHELISAQFEEICTAHHDIVENDWLVVRTILEDALSRGLR